MAAAAAGGDAVRALSQKELDIRMMLAADVHLGTKNCDFQMERYVFKRRTDGIYIINLGKTWEKLQLAARVIVTVKNPKDIVVLSSRTYGQCAVHKFAQYIGARAIVGRHTPGTFTNQLHKAFSEPCLLIVADPMADHQSIKESALGNIPAIAFCDTDSPMRHVTLGIPANNKGRNSIGCLFWVLARMVLQMRGTILPGHKWEVMADMFFDIETKEQVKDAVELSGFFGADQSTTAPAAPLADLVQEAEEEIHVSGWDTLFFPDFDEDSDEGSDEDEDDQNTTAPVADIVQKVEEEIHVAHPVQEEEEEIHVSGWDTLFFPDSDEDEDEES